MEKNHEERFTEEEEKGNGGKLIMRRKRSNSKKESNKSSITRPKKLIKNDYVILVFEAKKCGIFSEQLGRLSKTT